MNEIIFVVSIYITSFNNSIGTEHSKEQATSQLNNTKMEILSDLVQQEWLELPTEEADFIRVYDAQGKSLIAKEQNKLSKKEKSIVRKSDFLIQSANEKLFYLDK